MLLPVPGTQRVTWIISSQSFRVLLKGLHLSEVVPDHTVQNLHCLLSHSELEFLIPHVLIFSLTLVLINYIFYLFFLFVTSLLC